MLAGLAPATAAQRLAAPPRVGSPALRPPAMGRRAPFRIGPRLELRRWRYGVRPFLRRFPPDVPPLLLPPPPPDQFIQPEGPGPSPLIEGVPDSLPPLPHGFRIDVRIGKGRSFDVPASLVRYVQVGQALGRCFAPPAGLAWGAITLRVAFKRDGAVFGEPRIPYSDAGSPDDKSALARSLFAGLKRCAPLPLSPALGAAVAGEIFAIRFIHEDQT